MNRQTILSTVVSAALLLLATSCSNDNSAADEGALVGTTKNMEFKVSFEDYNADQTVKGTRADAPEMAKAQYVDLGNGLMARVSIKRDTTKTTTPQAATRVLADDTYTMLAYDAATHTFKGEVTGTVTSGIFTATSTNKEIVLAPGLYDFVLFNSFVSRSGNQLTVNRYMIDKALIGRTQYTVTPTPIKQQVNFQMKHAGARLRFQVLADGPIVLESTSISTENPIKLDLGSSSNTNIPFTAIYDASTNTWTPGSTSYLHQASSFNASGFSKQYIYLLPSTDVTQLPLTVYGTMYKHTYYSPISIPFNPQPAITVTPNSSYLIQVELNYNHLYLMSDGSTGFFKDTTFGGGTKTPVGVVVSQSKRLAIALKDAANGAGFPKIWSRPVHNNVIAQNGGGGSNSFPTLFTDMDGYQYTWDASGSSDGTTIKANEQTEWPDFYAAAHYDPGVPVSGTLVGKKWFLPSGGQWVLAYHNLGFGTDETITEIFTHSDYYPRMVSKAFTLVGGSNLDGAYRSSSEYVGNDDFLTVTMSPGLGLLGGQAIWRGIYGNEHVRPFINY